ncbi:MAG: hypothetical protein U0401_33105 [Anaerolineae bacterium]
MAGRFGRGDGRFGGANESTAAGGGCQPAGGSQQNFSDVHASITLVSDPAIIKSYPHSLRSAGGGQTGAAESRHLRMADYVEQTGCGQVVEQVTPESF